MHTKRVITGVLLIRSLHVTVLLIQRHGEQQNPSDSDPEP